MTIVTIGPQREPIVVAWTSSGETILTSPRPLLLAWEATWTHQAAMQGLSMLPDQISPETLATCRQTLACVHVPLLYHLVFLPTNSLLRTQSPANLNCRQHREAHCALSLLDRRALRVAAGLPQTQSPAVAIARQQPRRVGGISWRRKRDRGK
jgi:hypothetical protein